jgi:hypothetical protein
VLTLELCLVGWQTKRTKKAGIVGKYGDASFSEFVCLFWCILLALTLWWTVIISQRQAYFQAFGNDYFGFDSRLSWWTPRCQFEEADQEDGSQSGFKVLLQILWKGRPPKTLSVQESCFLTYIWLNCSVGGFMLINIITGSAPTAYEMQQKLRTKILL